MKAMKIRIKVMLWAVLMLVQTMPVSAQQTTQFAFGPAQILDTYLSPEDYSGMELRLMGLTRKPRGRIVHQFLHQGSMSLTSNRADNNDEMGGRYDFHYHLRCQLLPAKEGKSSWQIEVGGGVETGLGVLYNMRNGNNPVQVEAAVNIAPSAAAFYNLKLPRGPMTVCYELSVPVAGMMFSPNYGQSYYEIFSSGNYDNNIVPTTLLDTPSLRHSITIDLPVSKKSGKPRVRLGYLGDYRQAKVNNLKYHHYSHLFVIGWTRTI